MVMLDTNMILRYLLNDNLEMAEYAQSVIQSENAKITIEVIAEVVYVLKGVYSVSRQEIRNSLEVFIEEVEITEKEVVNCALDTYAKHNLDFVDCVLYAYREVHNYDILTFDKKLKRLLNTKEQ